MNWRFNLEASGSILLTVGNFTEFKAVNPEMITGQKLAHRILMQAYLNIFAQSYVEYQVFRLIRIESEQEKY